MKIGALIKKYRTHLVFNVNLFSLESVPALLSEVSVNVGSPPLAHSLRLYVTLFQCCSVGSMLQSCQLEQWIVRPRTSSAHHFSYVEDLEEPVLQMSCYKLLVESTKSLK